MDIRTELLTEFDRETAATRKILESIPDDADFAWKPSGKSMTLSALASHVTDMPGEWGRSTLTMDRLAYGADNKWEPFRPSSRAELLDRFDKGLTATRTALETIAPEKWEQNWQLSWNGHTVIDDTRYRVFRTSVLNHLVHHRAQLGVYIRLLGGKLPGCYGPSADEM